MAFTPSKYQKTLYTYIQKARGNAVVEAVAGGGKTSSLVNAIKLIPSDKQVLFLAFNKSIVEELKIKVGNLENVTVSTIHSLGAKVCRKYLKCNVDDNKYKTWLNDGIKSGFIAPINNLSNEDREEWLSNIRKLIDLGRVNLITDEQGLNELAYKHGLWILDNEVQVAIRGIDWGVHNTDIIGLMRLLEDAGIEIKGNSFIILGAGGASRAIVYLCASCGADRIFLLNRSVDKAKQLAEEVNSFFPDIVEALPLKDYGRIPKGKYPVIQTTSVGLYPNCDVAPVEEEDFYELVSEGVDIICNPTNTKFMKLCAKHGAEAYNGLKMLLYQGVAAYELWNNVKVPRNICDEVLTLMEKEMQKNG